MEFFKRKQEKPAAAPPTEKPQGPDLDAKLLQMLQSGEIYVEMPHDAPDVFERTIDAVAQQGVIEFSQDARERVQMVDTESHALGGALSKFAKLPRSVKGIILGGVASLSLLAPVAARKSEAGGRNDVWTAVAAVSALRVLDVATGGGMFNPDLHRERVRQGYETARNQQNQETRRYDTQMRGYETQTREDTRRLEIEARKEVELARIQAQKEADKRRQEAELARIDAQLQRDNLRATVDLEGQKKRLEAELARAKSAEKIALINARVQGIDKILKSRETGSVKVQETEAGMNVEKSDMEKK